MLQQRMEAVVSSVSGEVDARGREGRCRTVSDSPCIHAGSDDVAF